jgi:hypothetical protein
MVQPVWNGKTPSLAVFTLLIRGGPSFSDFETFVSSRECLRTAVPDLRYDDIAFHAGNVPTELGEELATVM